MLEGVLLGELSAVRKAAAASMRALHSSSSSTLHRAQQEHRQEQELWQERERELLRSIQALQQQLDGLQSGKAHSETQAESWQLQHAQLVRLR
jgi:outer membrane PBP1 activator LpoA protein